MRGLILMDLMDAAIVAAIRVLLLSAGVLEVRICLSARSFVRSIVLITVYFRSCELPLPHRPPLRYSGLRPRHQPRYRHPARPLRLQLRRRQRYRLAS